MEEILKHLPSRQITEYREWPDGRQGCLFYVAHSDADIKEGIYLVDSPCRKEDQPGEFNQLHRTELKALNEKSGVLLGALAGFFYHCIDTKPAYRAECWEQYFAPCFRNLSLDQQLPNLLNLCRDWLSADKQILNHYPDTDGVLFFRDSFLRLLQTILDNIAESDDYMLWNIRTKLPVDKMEGFSARFLNYLIVRQMCTSPSFRNDIDRLAQILVLYWGENESVFPMEQLNFDLPKPDYKKVCELYITHEKHRFAQESRYDPISITETTRQYMRRTNKIFWEQELSLYNDSQILFEKLPPVQAEQLKMYVFGFFHYLFRHLDLEDNDKAVFLKRVNNLFPNNGTNGFPTPIAETETPHENFLLTQKHAPQECITQIYNALLLGKDKATRCRNLIKLDGEYINLKGLPNDRMRAECANFYITDKMKKFTCDDFAKARQNPMLG